jgi:outer membrane protein TolC
MPSGAGQPGLLALIFTSMTLLSAAASAQGAPPTAATPWIPNGRGFDSRTLRIVPSEAALNAHHLYSLGELIDIAESNSPVTMAAWNRAKVTAASVGIAKSELYPTIVVAAEGKAYLNPQLFNETFVVQDLGLFDTAVHLSYTLADFGARRTEVTAAQAKLVAANLSFNNEHLLLIRRVSQSYFDLLKARGLREAAEVSLNDAQVAEAAAEDRRRNGLATVPEVLEAKAASAKATYDLKSALGAEQIEVGNLAEAITANPTRPFQVEPLEMLRIPDKLDQSVTDAINRGLEIRPDLQANQARVRAADAEVKHAQSAYYPTLAFEGSKGWLRAFGEQQGYPGVYAQTHTYDATLSLKWTVFDGLRRESLVRQANAEKRAVSEEVRSHQDEITNQVWNSYTNVSTALQQRTAATALLNAASESYSAALESYKDGVRSFLDVLAAEAVLAQARSIDVTARTQVLRTFTDLEFRTGDLLQNHPRGQNP